jgi:hypothetical protein
MKPAEEHTETLSQHLHKKEKEKLYVMAKESSLSDLKYL